MNEYDTQKNVQTSGKTNLSSVGVEYKNDDEWEAGTNPQPPPWPLYVAISLLSGDALSTDGAHLLGFLGQGAAVTAEMREEIGGHPTLDSLGLPDLSADFGVADEVEDGYHLS